ncbi:MAG: thermonuclease family protein [Rhodocyclaceae bacterium]|nr:thermonuclease family protein [Rhodocyclaceae bacterium]
MPGTGSTRSACPASTPPTCHQAFGRKSKANLSVLVFNRQVVAQCTKTDKYRREICKAMVGGIDANLEQLKAGLAWCAMEPKRWSACLLWSPVKLRASQNHQCSDYYGRGHAVARVGGAAG